jgi:2-keto-4-pentenoate hydratase
MPAMHTSWSDEDVDTVAADLIARRAAGTTRRPITDARPLGMRDAYRIQSAVTAARLARGERIVGWKLGYTSDAMRCQMGISEPNFGPLTDAMLLASGGVVSTQLMQPRVEPEVGVMFARDLAGSVTVADVIDAAAYAFACLEIVDSVYAGYRFRIEDNTADGSSAAQVVVGPRLGGLDSLDGVQVEFFRNGVHQASVLGSAASGHPALGVVWLAEQLAATGRRIRAGELVITGGLAAAVPLAAGDVVSATFDMAAQQCVGECVGESVEVSVRRSILGNIRTG